MTNTSTENQNQIMEEEGNLSALTTLVSNGCVDIRGRVADKRTTGGWRASPFIIANEVAERLAFFAIAVNLGLYLVIEMHESIPTAATHVSDWVGAAYILTILGAFLADAYLGRFKTIIIFSCVYSMGLILMTLSATIDSLRPPLCTKRPCITASDGQNAFFFGSLALVALGTGGIKPCVSSFGADQFDEADTKEVQKKYAFFNWFFFAINMGAFLAITVLVYVQLKKGFGWAFAIPTGVMAFSIIVLAVGVPFYRYQKPMGSPLTRFLQVIVASVRNHFNGVSVVPEADLYEVKTKESDIIGARKLPHTSQYSFFDKAAVITNTEINTKDRWRVCTITQVEEFKSIIRVLPIWASTIALAISFAQLSTFFLNQAAIMDRKLSPHFEIPTGSIAIFAAVNAIILVPIYEKLIVPVLRKHNGNPRGMTSLQRIGVGLFVSISALVSAALVEEKRRDEHSKALKTSVFWLLPQFFLVGSAEVFAYVGQLEFFYDEATDGTRSISSALFLSTIGIGSWINAAIVKIVESATGGQERGWLKNDLNTSRLDNFYWILTVINGVNFVVYVLVAVRYKSRGGISKGRVGNEAMFELCGSMKKKKKNDKDDNGDDDGQFQSMML
ncbi:hypothetical protein LWI29_010369 [Acer saccharum]|uniref:Uncharacterized protein n=1 Tax=Acer saccharum TaxID=4024 RepID=A0AA39VE22_ACESA|nr:hypothetical protein LWI29_010369 [Acer saccharum]